MRGLTKPAAKPSPVPLPVQRNRLLGRLVRSLDQAECDRLEGELAALDALLPDDTPGTRG